MNPEKYVFHHMFSTDGVGCSLTFVRKDLEHKKFMPKEEMQEDAKDNFQYITELDKQALKQLTDYNYVAVDPGKNNILFMEDSHGNTLRYTKLQRRVETKAKKKREIFLKENKQYGIKEIEASLSEFSSKTCDYERFCAYLKERNKINTLLEGYYQRELWRKLRWRSFTATQKSESILINKMKRTFGKKIVIGYGSYANTQQMKHHMPTPNIGMKRLLAQHFELYTVDEFRTSKICSHCREGETCYYKKRPNPRPYRDGEVHVHGLLSCKHCSKSSRPHLLNRDVNGATNILYLMSQWIEKRRRPKAYLRGKKKTPLTQHSCSYA